MANLKTPSNSTILQRWGLKVEARVALPDLKLQVTPTEFEIITLSRTSEVPGSFEGSSTDLYFWSWI
jgi:hypothetical protein